MADDGLPFTFEYTPPVPAGQNTITSTTRYVRVEGDPADWDESGLAQLARALADEMKALGDPGPFRWSLSHDYPQRSDDQPQTWALRVEGERTATSPNFLLRKSQLPNDPEEWKAIP